MKEYMVAVLSNIIKFEAGIQRFLASTVNTRCGKLNSFFELSGLKEKGS
jgi:hypothetical protein